MDSEIAAALIGVIVGGAGNAILGEINRRRERQSMLMAIATEVAAICTLIRAQQYLEGARALAALVDTEEWKAEPSVVIIGIEEDYFTVFNALADRLGTLDAAHASAIVTFYQCCKSAIDSHRPTSPIPQDGDLEERANHNRAAVALFTAILKLGDQIVQFPPTRPVTVDLALLPAGFGDAEARV